MADVYKIVKAADLEAIDNGLEDIADLLREKLDDETLTFTFPQGILNAINQLSLPEEEEEEVT